MAKLELLITAHDKASKTLGAINKKAGGLGKTLGKGLKLGALGAAAALVGLGVIGFKAVQAAQEQERVEKQLAATLKSTGHAAGLTAQEVKDMAAGLQKVTTFGDEATIAGQNILLTFKNIGKDTFPRATEAMLDVSVAMGQDMKASAIQLGKALNDPKAGLAALSRVGITFTDAQKEAIVAMQEGGDMAGAQALMLKELESQFGGSARAAAETFGGRMKQLQNVIGDLLEVIGFALIPILTKVAMAFTSFLLDHQDDIERVAKLIVKGLGGAFKWLGKTVGPILRDVGTVIKSFLHGFKRFNDPDVTSKGPFGVGEKIFVLFRTKLYPALLEGKDIFLAVAKALLKTGRDIAVFLVPALDTIADLWKNAIAPALAFVIPLLAKVGKFIFEHKPLLIALAAAILLLVAPWLAVVAAIAIVLAKWDEISAFFTGIGKAISDFVTGAIDTVLGIPIIGDIIRDTFNMIKIYVDTYLKVVILLLKTAFDSIVNLFRFWKAIFTGDWDAAWRAVKDQFAVIMNLLSGLFGIALDAVKAVLASKLEMLKGIGTSIGNAIGDGFKAALGGIRGALNAVITLIEKAINYIIGKWNDVEFKLPKVSLGPLGSVGGQSIGTPDIPLISIPRLSFQHGGFVPPGVVMPAILHGGPHGEDVTPRGRGGGPGIVHVHIGRVGVGVTEQEIRELARKTRRVFEDEMA